MTEYPDAATTHRSSLLLATGTEPLAGMARDYAALRQVLDRLLPTVDPRARTKLLGLRRRIDAKSVLVTFVGQVKAGKTALVNTLAGRPNLLPSDVNPWTSVVTTLHLNRSDVDGARSDFQFFEQDEWDRIVRGGGRFGEMAQRASADDEVAVIRRQVEEMRRKSQERLGKNFELLLGKRHSHDRVDSRLIERYVCMGDADTSVGDLAAQGRFADITCAADIYLPVKEYPFPVSFQDTPGVNDPFLMREQITLRCLRTTELCVVVLSAAQALNSVDLALIRMIATLDSRQIVIFVNRIDELDKPSVQVNEVRASLHDTLERAGIQGSVKVLFGSARWAEAALTGRLDQLPKASQQALIDWAEVADIPEDGDVSVVSWHLSGLPGLVHAIGRGASAGSAGLLLESVRGELRNFVVQSSAGISVSGSATQGRRAALLSEAEVAQRTQICSHTLKSELENQIAVVTSALQARMEVAGDRFVEATVAAMLKHVSAHGTDGTWECDPMRLRMQLRAAYLGYGRAIRTAAQGILAKAAEDMVGTYEALLGESSRAITLEPPQPPHVPPPVAIGKTIVVDLGTGWWQRWLRIRQNPESFTAQYRALIAAEAGSIIKEITEHQVNPVSETLRLTLAEFLADHAGALADMARAGGVDHGTLVAATTSTDHAARAAALNSALEALGTPVPSHHSASAA